MKQLASLLVLAAAFAAPFAHAQQPDAERNAVDAANRWLVLADAGDGAATWDQAASAFQAAISKADWSAALRQARGPLGAVTSRKMVSSAFKRTLPGAPDGEYVVIQYDTQFEHKAHAVETVVPMRERDGSWKVSGYFVK
jgi:hypothetical protein